MAHCTTDVEMNESMSPSDCFVTTKAAEQRPLSLIATFPGPAPGVRPLKPSLLSKCGHSSRWHWHWHATHAHIVQTTIMLRGKAGRKKGSKTQSVRCCRLLPGSPPFLQISFHASVDAKKGKPPAYRNNDGRTFISKLQHCANLCRLARSPIIRKRSSTDHLKNVLAAHS